MTQDKKHTIEDVMKKYGIAVGDHLTKSAMQEWASIKLSEQAPRISSLESENSELKSCIKKVVDDYWKLEALVKEKEKEMEGYKKVIDLKNDEITGYVNARDYITKQYSDASIQLQQKQQRIEELEKELRKKEEENERLRRIADKANESFSNLRDWPDLHPLTKEWAQNQIHKLNSIRHEQTSPSENY